MAKVSVIVPNYNHAQFLEQRLKSIVWQTYIDFEIIILDDASSDESTAILEAYRNHPKVSLLLVNDTNSGSPFKQWKKGIEHASGEFIWIAESDDYCSREFLEECMKAIGDDPAIGLVYTQSVDVDMNGEEVGDRLQYTDQFKPNIWKDNFSMPGNDFIRNYLSHKNVIPNASAVLFRKSLMNENNLFEEVIDMKMCGDWFFWLRLIRKTKIAFIANVHNYFRQHPDMSRMQKSTELKKQRLSEEHKVRMYLFRNEKLDQSQYFNKLSEKWFVLSDKWSIFKKDFYAVKDPQSSRPAFGFQFLKYKLKKRST